MRRGRAWTVSTGPWAYFPYPAEPVAIPYEGTTLPGYFFTTPNAVGAGPLLIAQTGFDGTGEEMYFTAAEGAVRRGYNCLVFEGPGQGRACLEQKLVFRPDWERVVSAVVDYAFTRPEVDQERAAILGVSFGGYLVPRSLTEEHRLKAAVVNGGVLDFFFSRRGAFFTGARRTGFRRSRGVQREIP